MSLYLPVPTNSRDENVRLPTVKVSWESGIGLVVVGACDITENPNSEHAGLDRKINVNDMSVKEASVNH